MSKLDDVQWSDNDRPWQTHCYDEAASLNANFQSDGEMYLEVA